MNSKKERTREYILEVSYGLFAKKGFNALTMKDICEETGLSRGGLYSHFPGTKEIFEVILEKLNQKNAVNFYEEMEQGIAATQILDDALALLENEMNHAEDSLSLAMYEYVGGNKEGLMRHYNRLGEEKWAALIKYGISRGEFKDVNIDEIVNIILYVYQGVRMWSRIVEITPEAVKAIISHIRKQLIKDSSDNGI